MGNRRAGDRSALLCMLVSVVASSVAPLLVSVSGAAQFPFLFTAGMQAGGLFGCLLFLLVCHRPLLWDPRVRGALLVSVLRLDRRAIWFLLGTVSGLDYALFAWSSRYVDVAVTTVLFETWPLFLVFLMALLYRGVGRYRRPTPALMLLLVVGFGGCALVVSSQHGGLDGLFGSGVHHLALGVGLSLLAALATSLAAYLFRWASALSGALAPCRGVSAGGGVSLELFSVAVGMVVSDVFSISMNAVIGFAAGESLSFIPVMGFAPKMIFIRVFGARFVKITFGTLPRITPCLALIVHQIPMNRVGGALAAWLGCALWTDLSAFASSAGMNLGVQV